MYAGVKEKTLEKVSGIDWHEADGPLAWLLLLWARPSLLLERKVVPSSRPGRKWRRKKKLVVAGWRFAARCRWVLMAQVVLVTRPAERKRSPAKWWQRLGLQSPAARTTMLWALREVVLVWLRLRASE